MVKMVEGVAYRKFQQSSNGKQEEVKVFTFEEIENAFQILDKKTGKKISENEIIEVLAKREKARKKCNFKEADELRNHLKKRGVQIIDQKVGKGKEQTTKWKYLDD